MQTDDEAPLTLSKWPFYLGDILLVATALAIAILGEWQLTDVQVVSCVVAVALGAAIFGLPFVVEYSMRVREEADDRSSETRLLKGHMQKAESALLQCHERLKELESGSGSVDQRYELLTSAVDHKLNAESQNLATLSQQVAVVESFKTEQVEALAAVKETIEALSAAPTDDVSSETIFALQAEIAALGVRLTEAAEPLSAIESRLVVLEESAKPVAVVAAAELAEAPRPAPRQRRKKVDSGLLHRAIPKKQDSASSAVSRIIDSKSKLMQPKPEAVLSTESESLEAAVVEAPAVAEAPAVVEAPAVAEAKELVVELDPAESVAVEGMEALPEDIEVSLGADLIEDDELLEAALNDAVKAEAADTEEDLIVEVTETPVADSTESEPETVEPAPTPEPKAAEAAPESAEAIDLFGKTQPAATRRARTKANDAIFTVSILIGIGNKPFLRGSGGGLSWESGVSMNFEEIGKWRWVAPADLEGPVEVQVYRNDEDADRKGRYTLESGQKLEVNPVF